MIFKAKRIPPDNSLEHISSHRFMKRKGLVMRTKTGRRKRLDACSRVYVDVEYAERGREAKIHCRLRRVVSVTQWMRLKMTFSLTIRLDLMMKCLIPFEATVKARRIL